MTAYELPNFSSIEPQNIVKEVEQLISTLKATVEAQLQQEIYTWDNLITPIDEAVDQLTRYWSPISHMNSVVSSDELREAHDACLPLLSEYGTWVGQHQGLYKAYQSLCDSDEFVTLNKAQQKLLTDSLLDFKLSGVSLPEDKKKRFGEIKARLSELSSTFGNNVMDATLAWNKHITDEADLAGLPESAVAAAAQLARQKDLQGWLFTLDFPSYLPVMTYADNAALREEMYVAMCTRASDQGPNAGKWDNSPIIDEILALKAESAELVGFDNYAALSLATKMAENTQQVNSFLEDLAKKSLPQAKQEILAIQDFAKKEFGKAELNIWDNLYYSEKLKQQEFSVSDEMLRPYFPETKVVPGLFEVVSRLYGITVNEVTGVDTWHKDVRFFEIVDEQGQQRGAFYLDLYAREKKRGGAWMDDCRTRRRKADGSLQNPVAYLTCNFNAPVDGKPALFTHDEVITLFHEFGHGLHHMLTQIEVAGVSGIAGVPWDAVELPSQFLENWCWEKEALAFLSGHYETNEPLPEELLQKMLAAKNFQSAMQMVRQLEFAMFDFRLHEDYQSEPKTDVQSVLNDVRDLTAVVKPPAFHRFQNGFSHIFAGGYAAGYYSYKWAEVLSADAFSRFEEEGIFNREVGNAFMQCILEMGGSEAPMTLFKAFRGREPQIDALLRHSGIQ